MSHRNHRQLRCIRHYADINHVSFEQGFAMWCDRGLAEQWAEQN